MNWKKSKTNTDLNAFVESAEALETATKQSFIFSENDQAKLHKVFTTIRLMFNRYAKVKPVNAEN